MTNSLFGFLSSRFTSSPENIATEALNYILNNSPSASDRMIQVLNQSLSITLTTPLSFSTQGGDDSGTIPDLIGKDVEGVELLLCEVKFWAGLTENQPVSYLKRLPKKKPALLLFLCPGQRIATLWPELIRRINDSGLSLTIPENLGTGIPHASVGENHIFAIISWREILSILQAELERLHDQDSLSDLKQLAGLCDQMDTEAFIPLRSEELAGNIGKRISQLTSIVDQVIGLISEDPRVTLKGLRATSTREGYRRFFIFDSFGCSLEVNFEKWHKIQETPIWLTITKIPEKGYWQYSPEAHKALGSLEFESPPKLHRWGKELVIPIYLPFNKDQDEVVRDIFKQNTEVLNKLP